MEKIKGNIFIDKKRRRILLETEDVRDEDQITKFLVNQGIDVIEGEGSLKATTITWIRPEANGGVRRTNKKLEILIHRNC